MVKLTTLTMAPFYTGVPVSHDGVTRIRKLKQPLEI